MYASIVCRSLEELVEPCGFPHFYLLATAGSARLKEEGSPSPDVLSSLSYRASYLDVSQVRGTEEEY